MLALSPIWIDKLERPHSLNERPTLPPILSPVSGSSRVLRLLWPAVLLAVLSYVVLDFVQHPFEGAFSEAVAAPEPHLTLWAAQTEGGAATVTITRDAADELLLYGRAATVGTLPGGASRAITGFFAARRSPDDMLAISADTVADLAQERVSSLVGENPLQAALAQRELARAVPVGVLSDDPLTIAVPAASPLHDLAELAGQMRAFPQELVFATTDDNWSADNLAALVSDTGVEGVVPYRVYPSAQGAALALGAGEADVLLAPRGQVLAEARARRLRALGWPTTLGSPPHFWVELLAAPGTPPARIRALRRQLAALTGGAPWRGLLSAQGYAAPARPLSGAGLHEFLPIHIARAARLRLLAQRVEHD